MSSKVSWGLKYSIFLLNFVFWVMGAVMVGLGTWAFLQKNQFSVDSVKAKGAFDFIFDAAVILLAVGFFVFVLAFMGCVGSLRENRCLLKTFYGMLIVVFLLEIIGATLAFVYAFNVKNTLQAVMKDEALTRYRDDQDLMNMIDFFQKQFGCCGIGPDGYKDWEVNPYFACNATAGSKTRPMEACAVPFSCCKNPVIPNTNKVNVMCGYGALELSHMAAETIIYTQGCMDRAFSLAKTNLDVIGGVVLAVAALQIVSIVAAHKLDGQIKKQMRSYAV